MIPVTQYEEQFILDGELGDVAAKVGEWSDRNLPAERTIAILQKAHGIHEEIGELVEAVERGESVYPDGLTAFAHFEDALGDIGLYWLDFCAKYEVDITKLPRFDIEEPWERAWLLFWQRGTLISALVIWSGRLSHGVLKTTQNIRNHENHRETIEQSLFNILKICWHLAMSIEEDLYGIIEKVAEKVLLRDWVANPDSAHIQSKE